MILFFSKVLAGVEMRKTEGVRRQGIMRQEESGETNKINPWEGAENNGSRRAKALSIYTSAGEGEGAKFNATDLDIYLNFSSSLFRDS